jgi:DNA-binding response OmpR family regulator
MRKILIIEDNQSVRENLEEILTLAQYQALTAANGKAGVEIAMHELPDMIICDVMMPELDGYGVFNILSRTPSTADIPFIFLTAKSDKEDFRRGMTMGADDYIPKPFDNAQLLETIETRLKKNERLRRNISPKTGSVNTFINEAIAMQAVGSLTENREIRRYKKKDPVFSEGEHPRWLFFIRSGKVKLVKSSDLGKEYIIKICSKGDFVGYLSVLKDAPYSESAIAMDDCEISLIPRTEFTHLVLGDRDVASLFVKMLASQMADMEQTLVELAYSSVRKRVANMLVFLSRENGNEIPLLREDMAALAGTVKETLIRTLSDFKREKLIEDGETGVRILNYAKLKNLPG